MIYDHIHDFARNIPPKGALLGLDYGAMRIGIAACDIERIIASPMEVYTRRNISKDLGHIARILRETTCIGIVIGLPLNNDGSESESCTYIRNFATKLISKTRLPVLLHDERFTTAAVTRSMKDAGVKRLDRHKADDKLAASYLLQTVIDML